MKSICLVSFLVLVCLSCTLGKSEDFFPVVPLEGEDDFSFVDTFFEDEQLILLGEASHGTAEFYTMRAGISKRLIESGDISFVAVEGDWVPLHRLNRFVRGKTDSSARDIIADFERWPQWMWANEEFLSFVKWLREYNESRPIQEHVGLYGVDVYGQWEAMDALQDFVDIHIPDKSDKVAEYVGCFAPYNRDERAYARAVFQQGASCASAMDSLVACVKKARREAGKSDPAYFSAVQKARAIHGAERFFRLSTKQGPESWNSRAKHFFSTTEQLRDFHGSESRGIVWAHNTHVGDARATIMAQVGQVNIGSVARERLGDSAVRILGFATSEGEVIAGRQWGAPWEEMTMPEPMEGSLENLFSQKEDSLFFLDFTHPISEESPLMSPINHRAVGVVYQPHNEQGNYVPSLVPHRYDGMIYIHRTTALTPLGSP
ncbi:erythromycin esterase family protein [Chitinivibrio alkaliphilus]|uniref:Erythromycin esterase n=1 Tax=Chitinivibrio alkaliphilus ACht1 TaxID=1313304 RepID=U7D8M4_9BACT|nr:erythromycin esterase family protein [Chitinivibrio alkaliphilus]ERP31916.1 hypothetical protein CALK_1133 [Chitinivibrio alkaliphilus ACht1]